MLRSRTILVTLSAVAAVSVPAAATLAATPVTPLKVHAIFGGGTHAPWHVGQVLQVTASGSSSAAVCWDPAPIDRPACSPGNAVGAPAATGTTTVTITQADGTTHSTRFSVVAARTHYDGRVAYAGIVRHATVLYGNYNTHRDHFADPEKVAALRAQDQVAVYNRLGRRAIFVWHYADNQGGFVPVHDVTAAPTA
jgi:hypothetical protein